MNVPVIRLTTKTEAKILICNNRTVSYGLNWNLERSSVFVGFVFTQSEKIKFIDK